MIKLKLQNIVTAEAVLNKLISNTDLDFTLSYKLNRLVKKIQPELTDFYTQKKALLDKFGTVQDDNTYVIPDENKERFTELYLKLLDIDIELTNVYKFKKEELAGIKLSVADIDSFDAFIEPDLELVETTERKPIKLDLGD
jgi:two-component SAPR family response regulator